MKKEQVLARLKEDCLVAVVRAKNLEQARSDRFYRSRRHQLHRDLYDR